MRFIRNGSVFLDDIDIGGRLRAVDMEYAALLAATIQQQGLQHPIEVMAEGNRLRLIAGAHRLAAYKLLGREAIEARIVEPETDNPALEIRFDEIVENVGRHELNALDRAGHLSELKAIWQELHPQTKRGGEGAAARKRAKVQSLHLGDDFELFGLKRDVRSKTGLSARTFFAAVKMWNGLSPATKAALANSKFAHNHVQLAALAEQTPDDQVRILKLLGVGAAEGEKPKATTVKQAWSILHDKIDPSDPTEKGFRRLCSDWNSSSSEVRREFIYWLALPLQSFLPAGTKYLGDKSRAPKPRRRKKVQP